jgi:hypothetical protein
MIERPLRQSRRTLRRLRPLVVGALAVADRRANAVGPVRLSCEADTLRLELLRVGRFAAGFALVGLAQAISFRVPYTAIRGLVREGHTLYLALDPVVAAPYNRFALARFSRDPHEALMRAFRLRSFATLLSVLLPLPLAVLAAYSLPQQLVAGHLGMAAVAIVVAWLSWHGLRRLVAWLTWGGPDSDRLRVAFEHTVAARLGLEPAAELAEEPAVLLAPTPMEAPAVPLRSVLGTAIRPIAFGLAGVMAVAAAAGAVLVVQRYGVAEVVVLPVDEATSGMEDPIVGLGSAAVAVGTPDLPGCSCQRADSLLWRQGVPQLSILLSRDRGQVDALWVEPGRTYPVTFDDEGAPPKAEAGASDGESRPPPARRIELDVAVVNNSTEPLKTIDLVVTFAKRDDRGIRRNIIERGLHWPRELGPGESVKWRVEASGCELRVDSRNDARLGQGGLTAAPGDAFLALREARLSVVRLHAAMMLSYLRDERATGFAKALGSLAELEELARTEILATQAALLFCDPQVGRGAVVGCLHNGTARLLRGVTISEPGASTPRSWTVRDLFLPGRGLQVTLPIDGDQPSGFRVDPLETP